MYHSMISYAHVIFSHPWQTFYEPTYTNSRPICADTFLLAYESTIVCMLQYALYSYGVHCTGIRSNLIHIRSHSI